MVQVDPIKPTLKAPGIKLSKLKHGKLHSNFGFIFNLRRYNVAGGGAGIIRREVAEILTPALDRGLTRDDAARFLLCLAGAYTRPLLSSS